MELQPLQLASSFLLADEIVRCCSTSLAAWGAFAADARGLAGRFRPRRFRLEGAARCVAARTISRLWRLRRVRAWMDAVARDAARLHAFPHRTETNYAPWRAHFRGGIAGIARIMATQRFTPHLQAHPTCPECGVGEVEVAWHWRDGCKMARSTPRLTLGCRACRESVAERLEQEGTALVTWFRTPRDDEEGFLLHWTKWT
jgi:hypothetical protein